jgi:thiamine biosynthesis lipoprotein
VRVLEGQTMGTYYRISYVGDERAGLNTAIDSLLLAFNREVNTYDSTAFISRFNQSDTGLVAREVPDFLANFQLAVAISRATGGAFDPTVMPLVNYWGFGYTEKRPVTRVDSQRIDTIMSYVGLQHLELTPAGLLRKDDPRTMLDFSAIAKGYGVDLVGQYLESQGIHRYLVDIGGELLGRGRKAADTPWRVGINVPREGAALNELQTAVPLEGRAIATSGNYRNYYEVAGEKYGHSINPFTGFPEKNRLLSASVFAADCATADAYATACMILGPQRAYELIESTPELEAYFIIGTEEGGMTVRYTPALAALFAEPDRAE